ncbi:MAG: NAD-dependent epimerase/dehydratase family protein [Acidimicrobiia bacterium]|nr:NAD-dependent epimerase/dehydratase family protein [Acidimicrobiia bacterium]
MIDDEKGPNAMKILVTGHDGYIGTVLVPMFEAAGHQVHGLDSMLFHDCALGAGVVLAADHDARRAGHRRGALRRL